ncbi:cytochrome c-type biogenesis protein CcmH [Cohaesibacter sp. ES.047]|uniref:c-type cytochrome biogenesis protein CcmI n=1 Tax=Cohaesibacter sp. ES.047 TaxID=1798205 RepID=UPI000BB900C8|nr:c-type cytochrome biogenesis protein CcmI [Cohaesibacter sp. ES.047]SNY92818.1 cytochrome c-type biogenesis protein CcmH [Cohaesibacter sp. ES.047]
MFWIVAGVITAITVAVVVYPLTRKARKMASADSYDLTVYASQLKEVEGDVERGLIEQNEADAARAEVGRRLLSAEDALEKQRQNTHGASINPDVAPTAGMTNGLIAAVVALFVIPLCSLGLYIALGSPGSSGQPLAERLSKPPQEQSMTELVASAERRLKANPDDLQGWQRLAPIYLSMRRTEEATKAYRNVLRLEGESMLGLANLGEALVVKDAGIVSKEALDLFQRANKLDPDHPKPRFFLAIALGQQGKDQEAINAWQEMINGSPADAPWVSFAKNQISAIRNRIENAKALPQNDSTTSDQSNELAAQAPGPTEDDVEAAAEMDAGDRKAMIEGMVSRLAERLDEQGGTAEEWVRLIRAELVLNRPDMAAKTVSKALVALQSDLEGLEKVKAAARSLGISVTQ